MHHDEHMSERTIKTMNNKQKQDVDICDSNYELPHCTYTNHKQSFINHCLFNMTVDNVSISKIHHDKRMNECTIGTMNTRWRKPKTRQWRLENVAFSSTDDLIAMNDECLPM